jgi:predicted transcriptional regulator of viral defense system
MDDVRTEAEGVILVRELAAIGVGDRQLRTSSAGGQLARLRRGAYVSSEQLARASDDELYDLRTSAVLATRYSVVVLSHHSALRARGIPIVNRWPRDVHLTIPVDSGIRSRNWVVAHRHPLDADQVVEHEGRVLTSLPRTLVDVARTSPFRDAVAAIDAALHAGAIDKSALLEELARSIPSQGTSRANRAIEFASPLAMQPGESFSRVLMHELRFPAPTLQHEFRLPDGSRRFGDFWWEELSLGGEFDGRGKYFDPKYTLGQSAEEVLWQEKLRENQLRDLGAQLTRWTWSDLEQVTPFIRRLEAAGLRRSLPGRR